MVRFALILLALPLTALANFNIEFKDAPLQEVVQSFTKEFYKSDYYLSPEINLTKKITISLHNKSKEEIKSFYEDLLSQNNIALKRKGSIIHYVKSSELTTPNPPQSDHSTIETQAQIPHNRDTSEQLIEQPIESEPQVFHPKYRPLDYFIPVLQSLNIPIQLKGFDYLVFNAPTKRHEIINALLEKIDTPITQYEITSATYEVTTNNDSQRSIDIIGNIFRDIGLTIATSGASNIVRIVGGSLTTAFKFFDSDTHFRSISKPYAIVKSGGKLQFENGQDVPTLGQIVANANNTQQSIVYRRSGVILNVELTQLKDSIDLKIDHELSSFVTTRTGLNNTPTLNKRSLKTDLSVNDGDIIVIGGLTDVSGTTTNVTALGIAPIERIKEGRQTETYIFLQVKKI